MMQEPVHPAMAGSEDYGNWEMEVERMEDNVLALGRSNWNSQLMDIVFDFLLSTPLSCFRLPLAEELMTKNFLRLLLL